MKLNVEQARRELLAPVSGANPNSRTRGKKRLFSGFNGSGMLCFTGGIPAKGLVVPTHPLARRFAGVIG